MDKPIVFLSHSSQDKAPLAALKKILDERAAGSLEFFLSSDGESIQLGRNWVVSVSDALNRAELMFIFLSPKSANSKWVHFEAGCAYAKNIQVVPVCLSGISLDQITPPLSLLQGFNLHTHDALGNLARTCNEKFEMTMKEDFSSDDYNSIAGHISGFEDSFFGEQTEVISEINLNSRALIIPNEPSATLQSLLKMCQDAGEKPRLRSNPITLTDKDGNVLTTNNLELPGCVVEIKSSKLKDGTNYYTISVNFSAERFHVNAPLIDKWIKLEQFEGGFSCAIKFAESIFGEDNRMRLTSKLHSSAIDFLGSTDDPTFSYEGFHFYLRANNLWTMFGFDLNGYLADKRLSIIVKRLFESQILWQVASHINIRQ